MKLVFPDYYPAFSCLADKCPDTCCTDWQVVIDTASRQKYLALSGPLGDDLRAALVTDQDGDHCFALTQEGRCPFLLPDGLCRIQKEAGHEALSETCQIHPRFWEEYGQTRELTLSLSCPAAAELLLGHQEPISFYTETDQRPVEAPNDLDPALYSALHQARALALAIVQDRSRTIADRLALVLLLSAQLQGLIDQDQLERLPKLLARFQSVSEQERQLLRLRRLRRKNASFFVPWMLLSNMEHLTADFPALLSHTPRQALSHRDFDRQFSREMEHLAVYFLFRWFLKAVNDGRVLDRAAACVFHLVSIRQLYLASGAQDFPALCRLYSKEVEHNDDNLRLLHRALHRGALRWQALAALL